MNRKSSFPFLTDFYICHFTTYCTFIMSIHFKIKWKIRFFVLNCKVEAQCIKMPKIQSVAFMQKWNSTKIEITEFLIEPYFPQKQKQ